MKKQDIFKFGKQFYKNHNDEYMIAKRLAFFNGAKHANNTMIQETIDWLIEQNNKPNGIIDIHNINELSEQFKKDMEIK